MSELSAKERNNLKDTKFGVPQLRKFPLTDEVHVRKAIQFFHHCPVEYKRTLAVNIYRECNRYNISLGKDSPIYDYLPQNLKENFDYVLGEGYDEAFDLIIHEIYMNEIEAEKKVDEAIALWNQRLKLVKTLQDKNSLLIEARNERSYLAKFQQNQDFYGIIQRAGSQTNKLKMSISRLQNSLEARETTSKTAVGSVGAKVAGGALTAARVPGAVVGGLASGAKPMVKAAVTVGAAGLAAKGATKFQRNRGKGIVKSGATGAAAGLLAGAVAVNALNRNQKQAQDNMAIRKHADKYVAYVNNLPEKIANINVSMTSGAIKKTTGVVNNQQQG